MRHVLRTVYLVAPGSKVETLGCSVNREHHLLCSPSCWKLLIPVLVCNLGNVKNEFGSCIMFIQTLCNWLSPGASTIWNESKWLWRQRLHESSIEAIKALMSLIMLLLKKRDCVKFLTVFTQTNSILVQICMSERQSWAGQITSGNFNTLRPKRRYQAVKAQKNMAAEIRGLLLKAGDTQPRDWLIPIHVTVQLLSSCKEGEKKRLFEMLMKVDSRCSLERMKVLNHL